MFMPERRQYKNPPIKEAICEFRFGSERDWDPLLPGKLQQALGGDYTGKAREQRSLSVGFEAYGNKPPDVKEVAKIQLVTEGNKRMVGVGRNMLSVHMLRPYQDSDEAEGGIGWEEFKTRISKALSAYWGVANPDGVSQVAIRYMNEIRIPEEEVRVDDYINDALPQLEETPVHLAGFSCRVVYLYEDGVCLFAHQEALEPIDGQVRFLLDFNVVWEADELISKDEALAKAEDLRDRERSAFEAFITDKSRDLFDA